MFIAIKAPQISSQSVSLAAKKVLQYCSHRNDLNPKNGTYPFGALGHRSHGGTDMKLTSYSMFQVCGNPNESHFSVSLSHTIGR